MNRTQKGVCLSTQQKSNKAEKTEQEFVERERGKPVEERQEERR